MLCKSVSLYWFQYGSKEQTDCIRELNHNNADIGYILESIFGDININDIENFYL